MPRCNEACSFDWQGSYERLAKAEAAISSVLDPPPQRVREVLRQRAATIAVPRDEATPAIKSDLVTFGFRNRLFAVDVHQVNAIVAIRAMIAVPGLPAFYLGLINSRGDVFPLLDINALLGMACIDDKAPTRAILVMHDNQAIAIAADQVRGHSRIEASEIASPEEDAAPHPAIRGYLSDAIVFDIHQLLLDARLWVDLEPTRARNGGAS